MLHIGVDTNIIVVCRVCMYANTFGDPVAKEHYAETERNMMGMKKGSSLLIWNKM